MCIRIVRPSCSLQILEMGEEKKLTEILELIQQIQMQQEKSSKSIDQRLSLMELNAGLDPQESVVRSSHDSDRDNRHFLCRCEGACTCSYPKSSSKEHSGHLGDHNEENRDRHRSDRPSMGGYKPDRDVSPRDEDHNYGRRATQHSQRASRNVIMNMTLAWSLVSQV